MCMHTQTHTHTHTHRDTHTHIHRHTHTHTHTEIVTNNKSVNELSCSSVGRSSDRHVADAGSIPQCGKGFFSQSTFSADSPTVSVHPRVQSHAFTSVRTIRIPLSTSDFGGLWKHKNTPVMHRMLGSATLSQLAFSGEGNPNFPWE